MLPSQPPPATRQLTPFRLFIFSLLLFVVIAIIGVAAFARSGRQALDRKIEELQRDGHPITAQAMFPRCAPEDDAGLLWSQAAALHTGATTVSQSIETGRTWLSVSAEDKEQFRRYLAENEPRIELLRQAASRPCFDCPPPLPGKLLSEAPVFNMIGWMKRYRVFALQAGRLAAEDGDHNGAMDCLMLGAGMARSFGSSPHFIGFFFGQIMLTNTVTLAQEVLPKLPVTPEQARQLMAELDPEPYRKSLEAMLELNRVSWLETTTWTLSQTDKALEAAVGGQAWIKKMPSPVVDLLGAMARPFVAGDGVVIQDALIRSADLARLEPWMRDREMEEFHNSPGAYPAVTWYGQMGAGLLDSGRKFDIPLARAQVVRVALACRIYAAEFGEFPSDLSQLAPAVMPRVPPDPFTGEPMVYRREPDGGFLLYSVGPDPVASPPATGPVTAAGSLPPDGYVWRQPPLK